MANAEKKSIMGMGYYVVRQPDGTSTLIFSRDVGDAFGRAIQNGAINPNSIPGSVDHFSNFDALQRATGANNIYPESVVNHLGGDRSFQTVKLPAGVDPDAHMRATYANVTPGPNARISQPSLLQQVAPQATPDPIVRNPATAAADIETRLGAPAHTIAAEAMHPTLAVGQTSRNGPISITQTEPGKFSYQHEGLSGTRIDVSITAGANPGDVRVSMSTVVGRQTQQALQGFTGREAEAMLTSLKRDAAGSIAGLGVNTQSAINTGNFNQTLSGAQLEPAAQKVEARRIAQRQGGDIAQAAINSSLEQTGASPQAATIVRDVTGINADGGARVAVDADGNTRITGNMPDRAPVQYAPTAPIAPDSGLGRAMAAAEPPRAPSPTATEAALLRQPLQPSSPSRTASAAAETGGEFRDAAARMLAQHNAEMPRPVEPIVRPADPIQARMNEAAEKIQASATEPPARTTAQMNADDVRLTPGQIREMRARNNASVQPSTPATSAPKPIILGREGGLGGQHGLAAREVPKSTPPVPEQPERVTPSTAQTTPDRPVAAGEQGPFVRQSASGTESAAQPRQVVGGDGYNGVRVELPADYRAPAAPTSAPSQASASPSQAPVKNADPDFIFRPQGSSPQVPSAAPASGVANAAAHAAEDAAHAPGIGQLARRFGGRLLSKVPLVGAAVAGGMAAMNINEARAEHAQGKISDAQFAAVVAGGAATTASSLGGFVTGTAVEEGVVAAQKAAGVPEHLQETTLRQTATALGSAIINRFTRPSTPVAGDTMAGFTPPAADAPAPQQAVAAPSAAAVTQNAPRDPNMQQALVQAQQSGAAQGAQATNMQPAQQDSSKAPPTTPEVAAGHSFGLSA